MAKSKMQLLLLFFSSISVLLILVLPTNAIQFVEIKNESKLLPTDDPVWIDSDDDFLTLGFNGSGIEGDPFLIENLVIRTGTGLEGNIGILIQGVTSYFIIRNCDIDVYSIGVVVENALPNRTVIANNTIHDIKGGICISVSYSPGAFIANNTLVNSRVGINLYASDHSIVENNYCGFNYDGMDLLDSMSLQVSNNTIEFNKDVGLFTQHLEDSRIFENILYRNAYGMDLSVDYCLVENNTLKENDVVGMYLSQSNYSIFSYNLILKNGRYGIYLSSNNYMMNGNDTFHHNIFIANDLRWWYAEGIQAWDEGMNNTWFDPMQLIGNYWWDYNETLGYYEVFPSSIDPYPIIAPDDDNDSLDYYYETYIYFTNIALNDTDNDGLSDGDEVFIYGTEPNKKDTDNDFLDDGSEVLIYLTLPLVQDSDNDTVKDGIEVYDYGTSPTDFDTDDDLMDDGFEITYGLNPLVNDSFEDMDGDGLYNIDEYTYNCNPFSNDTDNDGLNDYDEVYVYGTEPSLVDSDNDGLEDGVEVFEYGTSPTLKDSDFDQLRDGEEINIYHTNPTSNDTDHDSMPDGWEVRNKLDPLIDDSKEDPDQDGLKNKDEYLYGTDPLDWDSDGDGYSDGQEVRNRKDPLDALDHPLPIGVKASIYAASSIFVLISLTSLVIVLSRKGRLSFNLFVKK
ncbi:MAG: right-handed parallel beta-helix repeat-containing protein [Candidatus Heimdallarchaeaceae archaeon]